MKKLIVMFAAVVFATVASADVLYWMVTEDKYRAGEDVNVYAVYTGQPPAGPHLVGTATASQVADALDYVDPADAQPFQADVGSYVGAGWSYYIELVTSQTELSRVTWEQATTAGYLSRGGMAVPTGINGATAFGGVAANVPEPTSGLLFVIGGMLLGLKRKRQV